MTETDPIPGSPNSSPGGLRTDPDAPTIDHQPLAAAESPPRPVKVRRSGAGGTFFTLFLFLLLAGGLYYVWTNPRGQDEPDVTGALQRQVQAQGQTLGQQTAQLQAQSQLVQTLSDRIDKLEKVGTQPPPPAAPPDLGALPQKVDELSAKVAALSSQPAVAAPDLGNLPQRVDDLSAKVAALASQPAPSGPSGGSAGRLALAALSQRVEQAGAADRAAIAQLQTQQKDALDQAQSAMLAQQKSAIGQVQAQQKDALDQMQGAVLAEQKKAISQIDGRLSKLEQGAGTVEDAASRATRLERVQAAVVALQAGQKLGEIPGAPPELARFATQAPPTEAALRESFPALAEHARAVSQPDVAHRTFLQRALARLQQSVTVRQGDDVLVGDPAAGVLSDAEMRVQNGDLAGAVQRLGALHGPAAVAMAGWVDQARALVAARAALANLAARG